MEVYPFAFYYPPEVIREKYGAFGVFLLHNNYVDMNKIG